MIKKYLYVIVLIIVMLVITSLSYTYYINVKDYNVNLDTDLYQVQTELAFNGVVYDHLSPYYDSNKNAYIVNLYDETAVNFIGNISLDLFFEVPIASKMRFQLNQSYELTRYYQNAEQTVISEIIYQETIDDSYHPFSLLKKGSFTEALYHSDFYTYAYETYMPGQTYELNIISGGFTYPAKDNSLYYETAYLYLDFRFEFVQANRFSQVWQVDPLLLS